MKANFKIIVTKNFNLICSVCKEGKEIINEEVIPSITFNSNTIEIGQNDDKFIDFMKNWLENPSVYSTYQILFQGKEYHLLPEVFFAIIINEFKKKVEKHYIIENTVIELPTENSKTLQRIKISLDAVGLKNIELEEIDFDYSHQGELLDELLEKKKEIDSFKRMIERAKEINPSEKEKLETIDLNKKDMFKDEIFNTELSKNFSTIQRSEMKLTRLDNYCLFITSKYLQTLEDHINLIKISKRMERNMEKFHFNPISVNNKSIQYYPNVQTLHLYEDQDEYLEGGRIQAYCNWCRKVAYYQLKNNERKSKEKRIEFKRIIWTKEDSALQYITMKTPMNIPEGVKELDQNCFYGCFELQQINIPDSVQVIPKNSLINLPNLKELTISKRYELHGNKLFFVQNNCLYSIELPSSIKEINNKTMKFEITDLYSGGIYLYNKYNESLIRIGNIDLNKEENKNKSYCYQFKNHLNCNGIEIELCGKNNSNGYNYYFTPK